MNGHREPHESPGPITSTAGGAAWETSVRPHLSGAARAADGQSHDRPHPSGPAAGPAAGTVVEEEAARWRRLSGRSPWASGVKSLVVAAGAGAGLVRFLMGRDWTAGGIVAACAGAAVLIVAALVAYDLLRLRATRWRLTPDRLELRSGLTTRQHRSIPRDRVRSVDLRADPVHRMFGLTVVKVGTGEHAGDGDEVALDPLDRHEAEALRRTLLRQEERAAAAREEGPVAELRWSWVRYAPLSVWTFTGAAVVLGALYKGLETVGLKRFTTRIAAGLWEWVVAQPLLAVPLLLALNLLVGVLGAGLLFAESWARYRLEREPGRLRLRRGLLTARSLTLEERRLRGVEINEPLLLRLGGGARIRSIATGLGKSSGDETEDAAALTPPMPRALALQVAATIAGTPLPVTGPAPSDSQAGAPLPVTGTTLPFAGPVPSHGPDGLPGGGAEGPASPDGLPGGGAGGPAAPAGLAGHPGAALRRRVVRAGVAAVVAVAAAAVAELTAPWAWVGGWVWTAPVAVLVLGLWHAVVSAGNLGHALGSRHLIARRGAVVRRTVALDRAGIAGWTVTESFFQRRAGLLTVSATTAAGRGHYEVVDVGRADGLELAAQAVPGLLDPFLTREAPSTRP
ncbi:PH domain-containing protein [Nonomuraea candida]|uniref:PH domain-containing protein n=1 Tax=Nonomuraea candida TaxID=359159 RepID=UPI000694CDFD|nr:PH domain-containing protein [Nonomuraea candida]